ncbi:MAG: FG-GAP-like repeat-containing protein [Acidobacteriaceae bacterium]
MKPTRLFRSPESHRRCFSTSLAMVLLLLPMLASGRAFAETTKAALEAGRLNNVGVALMNQQLTQKAALKFEDAHKADPSSAIPVLNNGIAQLYLQKLPEAEAILKKATAMDAHNPRAWYALALTHLDAGNPKLAISDMEQVVKIDPSDPDAHYFLGSFYLSSADYAHAKQEYETAIKLDPLHASAHFGLARVLQRLKQPKAAHEQLARFQKIVQSKVGSPLSAAYGEQGRYAKVEDMIAPPPAVGSMLPVKFEPVSLSGGAAGGGACVLGIETPSIKDLVVLGEGASAIHAYKNVGGKFEELPANQTGLRASGKALACAVGDYDADGKPDLAVAMSDRVILFHNLGGGKFADVTKEVGIKPLNRPSSVMFIDFDHDGDVDLFVTGTSTGHGANVMWRNNGNSTFTDWTGPTGLAGSGATTEATLSDVNNDRAVDLIVAGSAGAPTIYENRREGPFKAVPLYVNAALAASRGVAVFDFNKDGWMDVAVTHSGAPGVSLWRNVDGKRFERVPLPLAGVKSAWGVTPIDIDNDGWIDLAVLVEAARGPELRVLRNMGAKGFEDVSAAVGADKLTLKDPRSLIAADVNSDGAADLVVTQAGAPPVVLKNVGGNKNHSVRITLTGLADNKTAVGTKVEIFANGLWQKFEVAGASGYLGQGSNEVIAGLGQVDHVDVVRLLWPTGVPQDEIDLDPSKPIALKELDRRGSSCPVLFAWNGKEYKFISDVVGAAVVGHWVSPTATNENDPDEWIKVDGADLKAHDGLYSLRFGEPMEEINYIDQLRLVAIDHPDGTQVFPDERFLSERPFASGKPIVVSSSAHLPAAAWNNDGHDVLPLLAKIDHHYVRDFKNLSYDGYANMHSLTLDLGAWTPAHSLRLLMRGYIEYFSATSMYAAWQAGLQPIPPYVEAQMPDGSWKRVINDMGFPAGLPRTIVVDLTGKLPPGTRKIRLTTNLQIYWDQVLVDNGASEAGEVRQTEMPLASARLAFRGYPQQIERATPDSPPGDLTYNYNRISATGPFHWQQGEYTRYGSVTPLLRGIDNRYVIFGSGEEIDAEFSGTKLPPLPPHWKRDYFFYANGFVKDMDFYEASPFTVAQMPFHGMGKYPYPASEHYPDDPRSDAYRLNWDSRFESGSRTQRYQFDYQPARQRP